MANSKIRVLIVDDEELICWSLARHLDKAGYKVFTALTGEKGLELFDSESPEVVLLDQKLPIENGLQILAKMRRRNPASVIIMMTAHGNVSLAVQAMKQGAYEYVNKPVDFEEIKLLISRALEANKIQAEIASLRRELKKKYGFSSIIGGSPLMQEIFTMIRKVANSEAVTVLIQGESGTGKDLVARAIHYESRRFDKPFVPINCSTLPETLLESELFGHEKGAFTDAKQMKKGQLELAEGGTIFLDEIGEISPATQIKLLRLLETRSFKRVGGTQDVQINVRIIAATNRDLDKAMMEGSFRQDLYYRLKVIHIWIPPLRERSEDIPLLARYFINQYNQEVGKNVSGIEPWAEKALQKYSWPGNVRELRNVIERILILEDEPLIRFEDLPNEITNGHISREEVSKLKIEIPDEGLALDEVEKVMIQKALEKAKGNQTRAARLLSISRDAMRYKMKKFGYLGDKE